MPRADKFLQANLNHAQQAQDLFVHSLLERGCSVGIAAEAYRVPLDHPCWAGDRLGSVAITWTDHASLPCSPLVAGEGYVAVKMGSIAVVGVYISPALDLSSFEDRLEAIGRLIRSLLPGEILLGRDFNAKSTTWGSPRTDRRGEELELWAASLGIQLQNR